MIFVFLCLGVYPHGVVWEYHLSSLWNSEAHKKNMWLFCVFWTCIPMVCTWVFLKHERCNLYDGVTLDFLLLFHWKIVLHDKVLQLEVGVAINIKLHLFLELTKTLNLKVVFIFWFLFIIPLGIEPKWGLVLWNEKGGIFFFFLNFGKCN
jgi:hypothetical protein